MSVRENVTIFLENQTGYRLAAQLRLDDIQEFDRGKIYRHVYDGKFSAVKIWPVKF